MSRKKYAQASKAMKDSALRALHGALKDKSTPTYVRVAAARTMLSATPPPPEAPAGPVSRPMYFVTPHNFRIVSQGVV